VLLGRVTSAESGTRFGTRDLGPSRAPPNPQPSDAGQPAADAEHACQFGIATTGYRARGDDRRVPKASARGRRVAVLHPFSRLDTGPPTASARVQWGVIPICGGLCDAYGAIARWCCVLIPRRSPDALGRRFPAGSAPRLALQVWLGRDGLDRELAEGGHPDTDPARRLRARHVSSRRGRRHGAVRLRWLAAEARQPTHSTWAAVPPLNRNGATVTGHAHSALEAMTSNH
jgi:hypothetical protein